MKQLIIDLLIDEEYAIVMSYRIAIGDRMFAEMWEPHQTSGFLCALFIKIFLFLGISGLDHLIIYLRLTGILLQCAVSLFMYDTLKKQYPQPLAFFCSLLCLNLLPKWIMVPEFSKMLLWGNLCTMLCFLRIHYGSRHVRLLSVFAALFTCTAVLAYPTYVLTVLLYAVTLLFLYGRQAKRRLVYYLGTCTCLGVIYILYFSVQLTFRGFLTGIRQMSSDGSHSVSMAERLELYAEELIEAFPYFLFLLIACFLLYYLLRKFHIFKKNEHSKINFLLLLSLMSIIQQMYLWLWADTLYLYRPHFFYCILYCMGFFLLKNNKALSLLGFFPALTTFLAAQILTNTNIQNTSIYLFSGIITTFLVLYEVLTTNKAFYYMTLFALSGIILFSKGYMITGPEGLKEDVFFVKQKALYGPAKDIYCRYIDGYSYNIIAELIPKYISEQDTLLCVSEHSIWYLLAESTISTCSTISTPTFDERLLQYWEQYPERFPDFILIKENSPYQEAVDALLNLDAPLVNDSGILLYSTKTPLK